MSGRILILGAAGRCGRAAAEAFRNGGWTVVSLVRPGAGSRAASDTIVVEDDGLHREAVLEAVPGADIVLHALNPPYPQWAQQTVPLTEVAIAAAEAAGATLMFPGNLYAYGKAMPEQIDESTRAQPTTRKGRIRAEIEDRLRQASERGLRTIVLRAGDFYGGPGFGSWFDLVIARDVELGLVRYPGPIDAVHSWAYLPDYAQALVRLAAIRHTLAPFESFGFPGHAVTGRELIVALQMTLGRQLRRRSFPWPVLWALSPFVPLWRELSEISYLWRVPHRISGEKLQAAIGEIPQTPFDEAVTLALKQMEFVRTNG